MMEKKKQTFVILTILWLTYFLCYCIRKPLSIYKFYIESELELSKYQLGAIDVALFLPYAGLQIFGANWQDQMKTENVMAFSLTLASLSLMLLTWTHHFGIFCLLVGISGAAQAPLWPACIKVLDHTVTDKNLVSAIGILGFAPYAGATLSSYVVSFISDTYGWRYSPIWIFVPCLSVSIIAKSVLSKKEEPMTEKTEKKPESAPQDHSLGQLLQIPGVKKVLVSVTFLKLARYVLYMWLPLMLSSWYGFTMVQAGTLNCCFYMGAAIGGPGLGTCMRYYRSSITLVMFFGAGSCFLLLILGKSVAIHVLGLLLFIIGFCNCGPDSVIGGAVTLKLGNAGQRNCGVKVTSVVNGIASIGGIIEGPMVSYLLHFEIGWDLVILAICLASTVSAMSFLSVQTMINTTPDDEEGSEVNDHSVV